MQIFLTGATGFIGVPLVRALIDRGDHCTVVSRSGRDPWGHTAVRVVQADPTAPGAWQPDVSGCEAVINLAGERIIDFPFPWWTPAKKAALRLSRIATTAQVVAAMRAAAAPPRLLVSGSAVGYYGPRGDAIVDETAPAGSDFLSRLAAEWEATARTVEDRATVALLRTGLVLGHGGGALAPMLPAFRLGLGGPLGDGRQWWSWIHLADAIDAILLVIDRGLAGPVNLTAPHPVPMNDFARTLGDVLGRPARLRVPALVLRLGLGEAANALLALQRVVPKRLLAEGYAFRFPTLAEALRDVA